MNLVNRPFRPVLPPASTPILQATIQVLLSVGKDRLTTTRVAHRAGVSVGTLYQYFPNKSSLLQATLRQHLEGVTAAVERASLEQRGQTLAQQISALITAFLAAKMRHPKTSVALYAVSSDLDAAKIVRQIGDRSSKAIVAMLESSSDRLTSDPQLVALMIQGAMNGVSRRLLETPAPEKRIDALRAELILFASSYLKACSTPRQEQPQD